MTRAHTLWPVNLFDRAEKTAVRRTLELRELSIVFNHPRCLVEF